jgi:hypothetical protein
VIAGRRTGRRRYSTRGYCSARGGVEGLGLALEASNQIDCQLIQSFPVREYISPITKISKECNSSTKRKPTSHDYGNDGGNRRWAWGRHHPWPRRLIGPAWALVWPARNINPSFATEYTSSASQITGSIHFGIQCI